MNRKEVRQYEMLVRVRDFGAAHADLFPEGSFGHQSFAAVGVAVNELREHAVAQMSPRLRRGRTQPPTRVALLRALRAIGRTARAIKAATPTFDNTFHPPRSEHSQALLAAARSVARDAEPVAELFIAREMPKTFIADLNALIEALEETIRLRDTQKDARNLTRVRFEAALASGLAAVNQLDVLVPNRLQGDPGRLAVWAGDRRIVPATRQKTAAAAPVDSPVAPDAPAASTSPPDVQDGEAA